MRLSKKALTAMQAGKLPPTSEADFQRQVIDLAQLHGWRVAHFRPGMNKRGQWMTAVSGDGAGFVDLVLCRERIIWAELKTDDGRLSLGQHSWMLALKLAKQEYYIWRPKNWTSIELALK